MNNEPEGYGVEIVEGRWKAVPFHLKGWRGASLRNKWRAFWGCDIWLGPVPFMRTLVLVNLIVWVLLFVTR